MGTTHKILPRKEEYFVHKLCGYERDLGQIRWFVYNRCSLVTLFVNCKFFSIEALLTQFPAMFFFPSS
jgi:hypothetical protein